VTERTPVTAYADANVCIALFAGPTHWAHEASVEMFRRVAEGRLVLVVAPVVVAEIVHAARTLFRWSHAQIADRLAAFLAADGLVVREAPQVFVALALLGVRRIDFTDAYLVAVALDPGPPLVASFDRDFDAIDGVTRLSA
jgi:predicted nucleic acid-binding protein